jgi:cytochrome c
LFGRQSSPVRHRSILLFIIVFLVGYPGPVAAAGDSESGARAFRACAACHTVVPGRHMTGPSLADTWGRKAGAAAGFGRYSPALRSSGVVWSERTLDAWLANPQALVPGNWMTFAGINDPRVRADLISFLRSVAAGRTAGHASGGGMTGPPERNDLKAVAALNRVTAIRYCRDTYWVTTAAGALPPYWEFNLRFKTDSSENGPAKGNPAIMGAGMTGDRASVIFADPSEISAFVRHEC